MQKLMVYFTFVILAFSAQITHAEIEAGRDFMESSQFEKAMTELILAAKFGNADAEELIGVMYAMGLGVKRDDVRTFEWYMRASLKGHPGA